MLGVATILQLVATAVLFVADLNLTLIVFVLALQLVLLLVYLWDLTRNERVPDGTERAWRLAILLAGPLAEPVYYWYFILGGDA